MKIYAYIVAAIMLAGAVAYGVHIVKKANRAEVAEKALADETAKHAAYVEAEAKQLAEFIRKAQADKDSDTALTGRITALEGAAAAIRQAASRIHPTVEKTDDKGVTRVSIAGPWWLCQSAQLGGDSADATACAAAGNGSVQP